MQGAASQWALFLECLPDATQSPVLWPEQQQVELLQNSPTLKECRQRRAALQQEWDNIAQQIASCDGRRFNEGDRLLCALSVLSASSVFALKSDLLPHHLSSISFAFFNSQHYLTPDYFHALSSLVVFEQGQECRIVKFVYSCCIIQKSYVRTWSVAPRQALQTIYMRIY